MIDILLVHISDLLNQNFKNQNGVSENKVVVSNLPDSSSSSQVELENRIICFLLSIEQETILKNKNGRMGGSSSGMMDKFAPLYLNLQLVFCANFKSENYLEGLNYLSQTISFFHQNRIINLGNIQGLSMKMDKLSFELSNLSYDNLSQVWSAIGSKVLPSVIYKVGLVIFDNTPIRSITPVISATGSQNPD